MFGFWKKREELKTRPGWDIENDYWYWYNCQEQRKLFNSYSHMFTARSTEFWVKCLTVDAYIRLAVEIMHETASRNMKEDANGPNKPHS
jgi:hypothetical protein